MMTRLIASIVALIACAFLGMPTATALNDDVTMTATIGGHDAATSTAGDPVRLVPADWAEIDVAVTNNGDVPVEIRRVTLEGKVLGLTFFSYATTVDFTVAPGATETLNYRLDLTDLEGQATGLIGSELVVTDAERTAVASVPLVSDVRGSLLSVYGLFGIALIFMTALSALDVALALARHRLPANRWRRGLRFLVPGVGVGLVLVFSASVARLWVPELGLWLVVAGLTAAVFFAAGYFSPTPYDQLDAEDDFDDDDFDEDADLGGLVEADGVPAGDWGEAPTSRVDLDESSLRSKVTE